ncbi:MAG: HDOD domain-containing protein, partial [Gammaproteobacteria bacterium]|nr:HDOD domain-containing protein [Gammaproteobacteria bacterium]
KVEEGLSQVKAFPQVVHNAIKLIDSESADVREIASVINKEPVLTARLLSLSNSSFYGFSKRISSVEHACVILGKHVLKNILISAAAMECFPATETRRKVWVHSIEVAGVAKLLADKLNKTSDIIYISGLLHDIGKFLLMDILPEFYEKYYSENKQSNEVSIIKETKEAGVNHAQVGAKIIELWNLPEEIKIMVEQHHQLPDENVSVDSKLLCLANDICHMLEDGKPDDEIFKIINECKVEDMFDGVQNIESMLAEIKCEISSLDGVLDKL